MEVGEKLEKLQTELSLVQLILSYCPFTMEFWELQPKKGALKKAFGFGREAKLCHLNTHIPSPALTAPKCSQ